MDASERQSLIRSVRQRLESLAYAGVDRVAIPKLLEIRSHKTIASADPARVVPPPVVVPQSMPEVPCPRPAVSPRLLFEEPKIEVPLLTSSERVDALATLEADVSVCTRCPELVASRTQTVFGVGAPTAKLMFIGEAPGAEEDRRGEPFVGRAGALLTDMITKGMGLTRAEVYIANVIKSRPLENRNPTPVEIANCLPYLERQIAIVRPEYLCLLGKIAASALLETALPMNRLRGKWHRYLGIATIVTWHPAYLLRNPASKKEAWDDLQMLMMAMGLKPPDRRKAT